MKNKLLIISTLVLVLNYFFWLIFSFYSSFNFYISSCIVVINYLLIYFILTKQYPVGARVSLSFITLTVSSVAFLISLFLKSELQNNIGIALILLLISFQLILIAVFYKMKFGDK